MRRPAPAVPIERPCTVEDVIDKVRARLTLVAWTAIGAAGSDGDAAVLSLDDLPEGVLAADLAVGELEEVAPAHLDVLPGQLSAADRPLRDPAVTARPVALVAVLDVRDPVEPRLDPFAHLLLADQAAPSRRGTARHVEHAVLAEERHHLVDVVGVEGVEERLQSWRRHVGAGHEARLPGCQARASRTDPRSRNPVHGSHPATTGPDRRACLGLWQHETRSG